MLENKLKADLIADLNSLKLLEFLSKQNQLLLINFVINSGLEGFNERLLKTNKNRGIYLGIKQLPRALLILF